jgi:hypothetical protein
MAISVRKNTEELVLALTYALNAMQSQVESDGYHRDLTQVTSCPISNVQGIVLTNVTVSAASATTLATTLTLANQVLAVLHMHMEDDQVHMHADLVNDGYLDGYSPAFDLTSVEGLLNAAQVVFSAHLAQSGVHVHNDTTTYAGLSTPATSLASAENLANSLASAINTHMANAGTSLTCPRLHVMTD